MHESEISATQDGRGRLSFLLRRCGRILYYHGQRGEQQITVLRMLEKGPMTQKQVQERLSTQAGSVSELLSKLESKRLLERTRSEEDRRSMLLTLTPRGADVVNLHEGYPSAEPYTALTDEECETLAQMLEKLLADWGKGDVKKP